MKKIFAALALSLLCQSQANALSVSFVQPDGVVSPGDSIEVWLRVTSDTDFDFDGTDVAGGFGVDPSLIPVEGLFFGDNGVEFLPFAELTGAVTSVSYICSGSFSDGGDSVCPPGSEYDFAFAAPGPDSFNGQEMFSLDAGESQDFLFGTFNPLDGSAAPGEYNFFGASITLFFFGIGFDEFGVQQDLFTSVTLATTCSTGDTFCDFSRVVVPVPAAAWLFASALATLGFRRRTKN